MIVAAHQPHLMPWLGYLDKVARADVFVVMDDLQYEAQNFQNRNRLKLCAGPAWITVPLVSAGRAQAVCDRRIDNTGRGGRHHWQHRLRRTLEVHYARTPHYSARVSELDDVFVRRWDFLLELDLHMLDLARRWCGITTPIIRASSLGAHGAKTDRIAEVCSKLGASAYLSGRGGSTGYLDTELLARRGIATAWQSFDHPVYPQRYPHLGFVSHLGFLDAVFNCGSAVAGWLASSPNTPARSLANDGALS